MDSKVKRPPVQTPPRSERRAGKDRRRVDLRLPGELERRRQVEPRKPEVHEIELTESQWAELQAQLAPVPSVEPHKGQG